MLLIVIPPCISALYWNSPAALLEVNTGLPSASTPHEPAPDESVIRLNNLVSLNPSPISNVPAESNKDANPPA